MMPSCPIVSVDENSPEMTRMDVSCPSAFPPSETSCKEIYFNFNNVKDTIGDATITSKYQGGSAGIYDLQAGTFGFAEFTENPACFERSITAVVAHNFSAIAAFGPPRMNYTSAVSSILRNITLSLSMLLTYY
jgi:hypothetical protein